MNIQEILLKLKLSFSITSLLVIINVLAYVLSVIIGFEIGHLAALRLLGAEYLPDIYGGQYWRFILPSFLHADLLHLSLNMWALYHLGNAIETFYGNKKILTVYILTGLLGSIFSVGFTFIRIYFNQSEGSFPISVGSSAAIFGFVGLLIGNKFKNNAYSVSIDNYINTSQLWLFVGYNVLIGLGINFFGSNSLSINNFAHIGGFVGGLILGKYLDLINVTYQSAIKKKTEKFLYFFSIFLLLAALIGEVFFLVIISN